MRNMSGNKQKVAAAATQWLLQLLLVMAVAAALWR